MLRDRSRTTGIGFCRDKFISSLPYRYHLANSRDWSKPSVPTGYHSRSCFLYKNRCTKITSLWKQIIAIWIWFYALLPKCYIVHISRTKTTVILFLTTINTQDYSNGHNLLFMNIISSNFLCSRDMRTLFLFWLNTFFFPQKTFDQILIRQLTKYNWGMVMQSLVEMRV